MKKVVALLLSLTLLVGVHPINIYADESEVNDVTVEVDTATGSALTASSFVNYAESVYREYQSEGIFDMMVNSINIDGRGYRADASGFVNATLARAGVLKKGSNYFSNDYMKNKNLRKLMRKCNFTFHKFDYKDIKKGDILVRNGNIAIVGKKSGGTSTVYCWSSNTRKPLKYTRQRFKGSMWEWTYRFGTTKRADFKKIVKSVFDEYAGEEFDSTEFLNLSDGQEARQDSSGFVNACLYRAGIKSPSMLYNSYDFMKGEVIDNVPDMKLLRYSFVKLKSGDIIASNRICGIVYGVRSDGTVKVAQFRKSGIEEMDTLTKQQMDTIGYMKILRYNFVK